MMGPSPVNDWTEKTKRTVCRKLHCKNMLKNAYLGASQVSGYKLKNSSYEAKTRYFDQFQLQLVCTQAEKKINWIQKKQ